MPNILQPANTTTTVTIEFVASLPLDLLNTMYFTYLAADMEAVDDFPVQTRARMDPALRAELDFLYTYPTHQAGVMGTLNDVLFLNHEELPDVDALLRYVRALPATLTPGDTVTSVQALVLQSLRVCGAPLIPLAAGDGAREMLRAGLAENQLIEGDPHPAVIAIDPAGALTLFDRPEELRARMLTLIRRFYDEHYRPDEERRLACMRRSVDYHRDFDRRRREPQNIEALVSSLSLSNGSSMASDVTSYSRFTFLPSVDVGPYTSCADVAPVYALYYPCEPEFRGETPDDEERTRRVALVYKALSDEQRLRILRELRDGELYVQEVVERTGIHQSVASRHLTFLKAVGLVTVRRQNNMKFYSLNMEMRDELRQAVDAVLPATSGGR